jgi:hypothetical protein
MPEGSASNLGRRSTYWTDEARPVHLVDAVDDREREFT